VARPETGHPTRAIKTVKEAQSLLLGYNLGVKEALSLLLGLLLGVKEALSLLLALFWV